FPRTLAMAAINLIQHILHFLAYRLAKLRWSKLHTRFDQRRILFHRDIGITVFVVEDPAFTLGDNLFPKFFRRKFVSPLAKRALRKLLNISFMNERYRLTSAGQGKLNRHANQSLRSGDRNRLDANT